MCFVTLSKLFQDILGGDYCTYFPSSVVSLLPTNHGQYTVYRQHLARCGKAQPWPVKKRCIDSYLG